MKELNQRRSNSYAAGGTLLVWLLIFLAAGLSGGSRPKVYKTVKILIDAPATPKIAERKDAAPPEAGEKAAVPSSQTQAATQSASKPQETKSESSSQSKLQSKPAEKPVSKPGAKAPSQPAKTATPAPQKLAKSVDDSIAEMNAKPKAKKVFDWSQMDEVEEESSDSSSVSSQTAPGRTVDALSGSAATSASEKNSSGVSASSSNKAGQKASSGTNAVLGKITASNAGTFVGNGITATSSAKQASSPDGRPALYMSDGSGRYLIEPKDLSIPLSSEAQAQIFSSMDLNITFTVKANGRVDINSIRITPESLVKPVVQSEISAVVRTWRFNEVSGGADVKGVFEYKITRK